MFKKTLHTQLYLSYLLITLFSLGAIGWYTVNALNHFYYEQTSADLESRARLIQHQVSPHFASDNIPALKRQAETLGQPGTQRVTLILPDGTVIGGPVKDEETIVYADIDLGAVRRERQNFDPSGHYSRADVLELTVDRTRKSPARFRD